MVLLEMDKHKNYSGGINRLISDMCNHTPASDGKGCHPPATRKLRDWRRAARQWLEDRQERKTELDRLNSSVGADGSYGNKVGHIEGASMVLPRLPKMKPEYLDVSKVCEIPISPLPSHILHDQIIPPGIMGSSTPRKICACKIEQRLKGNIEDLESDDSYGKSRLSPETASPSPPYCAPPYYGSPVRRGGPTTLYNAQSQPLRYTTGRVFFRSRDDIIRL